MKAPPGRERRPAVMAIGVAGMTGILLLVAAFHLWPLNRYALATAAQLVNLGAAPGWWLSPTASCQPLTPPAAAARTVQARLQRLYGIQAAFCGQVEAAQTAWQAAAAALPGDTSLALFTGRAMAGEAVVGPALAAERARTAYERGDEDEAARWLQQATTYLAEPANADYRSLYFAACYIYRGLRQLDASLDACTKYAAVSPTNKEAWNHLAATHLARREWAEAEAALNRALALDPTWLPAAVNLVTALTAQGKDEAALAVYAQAQAQAGMDAWSSYRLAQMAVRLRRCAEARMYLQAAATDPPAALTSALTALQRRFEASCP